MKKLIITTVAIATFVFITALVINQVSGSSPNGAVGKPIPASVMKIAERSCVHCHAEPGNGMALAHVNLSNWDKYSPEKQAAKANDMCKMVTKDKMPPKSFREKNPGAAPTTAELKTLCDWAESLQVAKK